MVFVTSSDQPSLILILSHTLQRQSDSTLLFLVDFLAHRSNGNGTYSFKYVASIIEPFY